jgi:hypothetical protein
VDTPQYARASEAAPEDALRTLRAAARRLDLGYEPVALRGWLPGGELILAVRRLGGAVRPAEPFQQWILEHRGGRFARLAREVAPDLSSHDVALADFVGVVELTLDGQRFLALRSDAQVTPHTVDRALVLGGPSLESLLRLAGRLKAAAAEVALGEIAPFGTGMRPNLRPVAEDDLILPETFKRELLEYLDAFWGSATLCADLGVAPTRGVLFLGAPGTGKTHLVRHLLGRYGRCRRFVYLNDSATRTGNGDTSFRALVEAINAGEQPALVVIEDIDRILDKGIVTPEFLLNVLDGLFEPTVPVLWLATSNDPTDLADNLLDRPGRFDRIVEFPLPGPAERLRMLRRYSPWPVEEHVLRQLVRDSVGLTGAHIKSACVAAAMATAKELVWFASALEREFARLRSRAHRGRDLIRACGNSAPVGYAP